MYPGENRALIFQLYFKLVFDYVSYSLDLAVTWVFKDPTEKPIDSSAAQGAWEEVAVPK